MADSWDDQRAEVRRLLVAAASSPSDTAVEEDGQQLARAVDKAATAAAVGMANAFTEAWGGPVTRIRRGDLSRKAFVQQSVESARQAVVTDAVEAGMDAANEVTDEDRPARTSPAEPAPVQEAQDKARGH